MASHEKPSKHGILTVEFIKSDVGFAIFETLKAEGWRVTSEYSPLMFDKGIDFDAYTLKKEKQVIYFEWTNWFEWEIKAKPEIILPICERFALPIPEEHE